MAKSQNALQALDGHSLTSGVMFGSLKFWEAEEYIHGVW